MSAWHLCDTLSRIVMQFPPLHHHLLTTLSPLIFDDVEAPETDLTAIDHNAYVELASTHRLTPLLLRALSRSSHAESDALRARLKPEVAVAQRKSFLQVQELLELHRCFALAGIDWLTVKGVLLSAQLYGDPGYRMSKDVDVWVDPVRFFDAYDLLLKAGYKVTDYELNNQIEQDLHREVQGKIRKHICVYHPDREVLVEVHWQLEATADLLPDWAASWAARRHVVLGGVPIATLSDHDMLMYLSYHGNMHQWRRMQWLVDLCRFCQVVDKAVVEQALRTMRRQRLMPAFRSAMVLRAMAWGSVVPGDAERWRAGERWMARIALYLITQKSDTVEDSVWCSVWIRVYRGLECGSLWEMLKSLHRRIVATPKWLRRFQKWPYLSRVLLAYAAVPWTVFQFCATPRRWMKIVRT